eukprot:m.54611 g.54611  ORF g.54611 m.54611 type:complete len:857 (-) comp11433_c0_seq3:2027-4597(-)
MLYWYASLVSVVLSACVVSVSGYSSAECRQKGYAYACTPNSVSSTSCGCGRMEMRSGSAYCCHAYGFGTCITWDLPQAQSCSHPACRSQERTYWGSWGGWSSCSTSCGTGTRRRTRTCVGGYCNVDCTKGSTTSQTKTCSAGSTLSWASWGPWGSCSTSCGTGSITRTRTCTGCVSGSCSKGAKQSGSAACSAGSLASWSDWSDYGACSTTCGYGQRTSTRVCQGCRTSSACSLGAREQRTLSCSEGDALSWSTWSLWSACSESCGEGTKTKTRSCLGCLPGSCNAGDEGISGVGCSSGDMLEWTAWIPTTSCSTDCGIGQQTLQRVCAGCVDGTCPAKDQLEQREASCSQGATAAWTQWTAWSLCDTLCGTGQQQRRRRCDGCLKGDCDLGTEQVGKQSCDAGAARTWSLWSPWAACNTDCGQGQTTRSRSCVGCVGTACDDGAEEAVTDICVEGPVLQWSTWSAWGECSPLCTNGTQTRDRVCTGCNPGACEKGQHHNDTRACVSTPDIAWSAWSAWSDCSEECGNGTRVQTRECTGCPSPDSVPTCDLGKKESNFAVCITGQWNEWTEWQGCEASQRTRTRQCGEAEGCAADCVEAVAEADVEPCHLASTPFPDKDRSGSTSSTGMIVGAVVGGIIVVVALLLGLWFVCCRDHSKQSLGKPHELSSATGDVTPMNQNPLYVGGTIAIGSGSGDGTSAGKGLPAALAASSEETESDPWAPPAQLEYTPLQAQGRRRKPHASLPGTYSALHASPGAKPQTGHQAVDTSPSVNGEYSSLASGHQQQRSPQHRNAYAALASQPQYTQLPSASQRSGPQGVYMHLSRQRPQLRQATSSNLYDFATISSTDPTTEDAHA